MSNSSKCSSNYTKKCCNICYKTIAKDHKIIHCQNCNSKVHINCNKTDIKSYNKLKRDNLPQMCFPCQSLKLPFQNLTDTQFSAENKGITFTNNTIPKTCCGICTKTIAKNHRNIKCQTCNCLVHIKCNQTDVKSYNKIIKENLPQTCFNCQTKNNISQNLPDLLNLPGSNSKTHCGVCTKVIAKNHRNIHCNSCNSKVHIKCNKTDVKTYNKIIKDNISIICNNCQTENIPFHNLTDLQFSAVNKGLNTDTEALEEISVTSTSLKTFFKEINRANPFVHIENEDGEEDNATLINCKYVDLISFKYKPKKNDFSLFHTNLLNTKMSLKP